jgi:hypothetical protein
MPGKSFDQMPTPKETILSKNRLPGQEEFTTKQLRANNKFSEGSAFRECVAFQAEGTEGVNPIRYFLIDLHLHVLVFVNRELIGGVCEKFNRAGEIDFHNSVDSTEPDCIAGSGRCVRWYNAAPASVLYNHDNDRHGNLLFYM